MNAVHCLECQSYDTNNRVLFIAGQQVNDCYNCHSIQLEDIIIPPALVDLLSGFGKMVETKRYNGDLPVCPGNQLIDQEVCAICLTNENNPLGTCKPEVQTLCNHRFHQDCMRKWLVANQQNTCPYCRSKAFAWYCADCVKSYVIPN